MVIASVKRNHYNRPPSLVGWITGQFYVPNFTPLRRLGWLLDHALSELFFRKRAPVLFFPQFFIGQ
jgi:hypothetical protein